MTGMPPVTDSNPALPSPASPVTILLIATICVAALYFGQDVLKPLALAILLAFALAPLVVRLRRLGLGRILSAALVVLLVAGFLAAIALVVSSQLFDLAAKLPTYEQNLLGKIKNLRDTAPSGGVVDRTIATINDLNQELSDATTPAPGTVGKAGPEGELEVRRPVPVELHEPEASPVETLMLVAGPLIGPIATAGVVIVFVIFMLVQREDLRDRAIRLLGARDLARATGAMNDAASRVSRYLLMQLIINILYGIPIGIGLWLIGLPSPLLWGLLATILRFIPYLGPILSASFPLALSLAVDPGWNMLLMTLALVVVLELFSNNVLEPWLYGASTGLSPVAILIAAVFWTTLWGPVGLLLATPLTVCLVVLGRHVPALQFLDILLGDQPPLAPPARLYQRLLTRDIHEAMELAEEQVDELGSERCCEQLLLPALAFAERDRERGLLSREIQQGVAEGIESLLDFVVDAPEPEASEAEEKLEAAADSEAEPAEQAAAMTAVAAMTDMPEVDILCLGARNELDRAAAAMLARLLEQDGRRALVLSHVAATPLALQRLRREGVGMICVCYVGLATPQYARRLARRLRSHLGKERPLLAIYWNDGETVPEEVEALGTEADMLLTSLPATLAEIRRRTTPTIADSNAGTSTVAV